MTGNRAIEIYAVQSRAPVLPLRPEGAPAGQLPRALIHEGNPFVDGQGDCRI